MSLKWIYLCLVTPINIVHRQLFTQCTQVLNDDSNRRSVSLFSKFYRIHLTINHYYQTPVPIWVSRIGLMRFARPVNIFILFQIDKSYTQMRFRTYTSITWSLILLLMFYGFLMMLVVGFVIFFCCVWTLVLMFQNNPSMRSAFFIHFHARIDTQHKDENQTAFELLLLKCLSVCLHVLHFKLNVHM